jgi:iron complex transport system ATP-binding protein
MRNSPVLFQLEKVSFGYRKTTPVLSDLDLVLERSKFHALIGPNGAGKSTLLRLLTRRLSPHKGCIFFQSGPLSETPAGELARKVAVVPQGEPAVFEYTVREMVLMGRFPYRRGFLGSESRQDHRVVDRCLEETDLTWLADRPLGALSGGERQRVLVARALAQEPEALLLDEPTSAMDPRHQKLLFDLLLRLKEERDLTLVLVTHDLSLVGTYTDQVHVLVCGGVTHAGPAEEIIRPEILSEVFNTGIGVERDGRGTVHVGLLR